MTAGLKRNLCRRNMQQKLEMHFGHLADGFGLGSELSGKKGMIFLHLETPNMKRSSIVPSIQVENSSSSKIQSFNNSSFTFSNTSNVVTSGLREFRNWCTRHLVQLCQHVGTFKNWIAI
jgi:hypothetical protein